MQKSNPKNIAIILAGGIGSRYGANRPKQYTQLAGFPIARYALRLFTNHPHIDRVLLVVASDYVTRVGEELNPPQGKIAWEPIAGGATRSASAYNAIKALSEEHPRSKVLIHDAARPLLTPVLVSRMLEALEQHEAAICAIPPSSTIVEVDSDNQCLRSLPQSSTRLVQTPQAFRLQPLREAYDRAFRNGDYSASDDATLFATFSPDARVACVEGELENIKITHPHDRFLAEMILEKRENAKGENSL